MTPLLIAVRHGETDYNARDCWLGHLDPPLNEKGIEHARRMANRLASYDFSAIYSSPFIRARHTAEIIAGDPARVIFDDRLKEVSFGEVDGMPIAEAKQRGIWQDRDQNRMSYKPPGGESYYDVLARVEAFFTERNVLKGPGPVLIVSHKGTMRMIEAHLGLVTHEVAAHHEFGHESRLIVTRTQGGTIEARIED